MLFLSEVLDLDEHWQSNTFLPVEDLSWDVLYNTTYY